MGMRPEAVLGAAMGYVEETLQGAGALKGEKGDPGEPGRDGVDGQPGQDGAPGQNGVDGQDGKSAYDIWLEQGNTGTEEDFLISLKGEPGEKGADGTMSFEDLTEEQKESLKCDEGKSAYQIWLDAGNTGSEEEFLESLKGDGADVEFDDMPTENSDNAVKSDGIFKALGDKQDSIIILEGYKTQEEDGFGNYIIDPAPNYTNKELLEMLKLKKKSRAAYLQRYDLG